MTGSPPLTHQPPLTLVPKRLGVGLGGGAGAAAANGLSGNKRPLSVMQQHQPDGESAAASSSAAAASASAAIPFHVFQPLASASSSHNTATPAPWASPPPPVSIPAAALSSSSLSVSASPPAGGYDVLLVEDVRVAQRIAARVLTAAHYRVDVASSGESAVEKFKLNAHTLRIVLMDINLPGISGTDATEMIRAWERANAAASTEGGRTIRSPVMVFGLTGNVDESNLRLYEAAGMNGCIGKGKQLGEAVERAIQMHTANPGVFVNLASAATLSPEAPAISSSRLQPATATAAETPDEPVSVRPGEDENATKRARLNENNMSQ